MAFLHKNNVNILIFLNLKCSIRNYITAIILFFYIPILYKFLFWSKSESAEKGTIRFWSKTAMPDNNIIGRYIKIF